MSRTGLCALAALLAGCSVGPEYVRPTIDTPAAYSSPDPNSPFQPAQPQDAVTRGAWWRALGDAELDDLEDQVTAANQNLKLAEARFRQARALIGYQQASEYPTLSVAPSAQSVKDSAKQPYFTNAHPAPTREFNLPLDLSYEVDLWGRVRHEVAAARAEATATAADLATAGLSLHAELAIDFVELRSADAQQKLLDDTVAAYADALKLTLDRQAGGAASDADVALAQTQLETVRVEASDVGVRRAQYEHAIAVLIGKPPSGFSIAVSQRPLKLPPTPAGLPSALLQRRPDIAAAERRVAEANEQIGIAEAAFYPTITLGGAGGVIGNTIPDMFSWPATAWALGASASQVLFDAGRRNFQSEAQQANYDATVAQYRQTTLQAFQDVEDNLAALAILDREADQQRRAVAAAQNSLDIFTNRYRGGLDAYLTVVTAQSALLLNERNDVDLQRRRVEADILLIKALGGGWNTDDLPVLTADQH